jgi:type IV secretion system protein VirD4
VDADERARKQAVEREASDLRWMLSREAADARRSIDNAKWDVRREFERQAPAAKPAAGRGSFLRLDRPPSDQRFEDALLVWALPAAAVLAVPLVVGHLAAFLAHGAWPRYPLSAAPGVLVRLLGNLGDPGRAWEPVNTGAPVPGFVGFWSTFALVGVIGTLIGLLVWAMLRPAGRRGSGWAGPDELRDLRVARKGDDRRLVVGTASGDKLALRDRHSLLVIGPAHSGKSSGLVVPAVVEWRGPVIVAATKGHVIDQTIGWRSRQGDVHVYDPAGVTPYYRSGWSLLADCATWQGAIRTAADLTLAARGAGISEGADREIAEGQGDLWRSAMAMALAPYLLAAISSGQPVSVAAGWIQREEHDEVLEILKGVDRMAARTHESMFMREDTSRSHFLSAMHNLLSVYDDPVVAESGNLHEIVPSEILDGGSNTLYLTTPEHDQARFRPLCSMIVRRLIAHAYEQSAQARRALGTPLLVVLDDVLGIAPIYDLASLASTAPARGVQLVSVFQDTDQIAARYGDHADAVIRNHGAKLVLAGRPAGRPFAADLLPAKLSDQLTAWEAALLYGKAHPARVRLRPWFRDRELRRYVQTPQDAVRSAEGRRPSESWTPFDPVAQRRAWSSARGRRRTDETIPLDTRSPEYIEVFGTADEGDDTAPNNVTPLPGSHWRGER